MRLRSALLLVVCVAMSAPAFGQAASVRRAPAKKTRTGFRAYVIVESESLKATTSFDAVLGTSKLTFVGAGGDVVNLWKRAFVRLDGAHGSKTGTRVDTSASPPISNGIPLTVSMTPIEIGGGWRFASFDRKGHVAPYVGATAVLLRYRETSRFSDPGEDTDTTLKGSGIFGGVDVSIRIVRVAVEGVYRHVPNALGVAGISQGLNENNLGGGVVRLAIGIGF